MKILSRFDKSVLFENASTSLKDTLQAATIAKAALSRADLFGADLYGANLFGANLYGASLYGANLSGANLSEANLSGANLYGANLSGASLYGANLSGAVLFGANLFGASLFGANLSEVHGLAFQIPQEGELIVYKKLVNSDIAKLRIPPDAKRTATPVGRKCRAEFATVLEIIDENDKPRKTGRSTHDDTRYVVGRTVTPDSYDDDIRVECTHGIHFFLTREEAEAY
jgi:Family of unknown function (DUF5758)/Pentapeptide repeats (8 copies)